MTFQSPSLGFQLLELEDGKQLGSQLFPTPPVLWLGACGRV